MPTIQEFLERNQLPQSFTAYAEQWFDPLLDKVCEGYKNNPTAQPLLLGISGCQGSGKSTLADYLAFKLEYAKKLKVANCSLDDFYLKKSDRANLAKTVHPLLQTRGVPGTHDTQLAMNCFHLLRTRAGSPVRLPVFDKLADDRASIQNLVPEPVDIIIFEGWCLGAEAQSTAELQRPINQLEQEEDRDTSWRNYVNQKLEREYKELFGQIDFMIMLKAPSFECVLNWRTEQEEKLAKKELQEDTSTNKKAMTKLEIKRFISHYQRITEQLLVSLPDKADVILELDKQRQIQSAVYKD